MSVDLSTDAGRRTSVDLSAEAALLLSHWWSRPTGIELAVWDENFPVAAEVAENIGCDPDLVAELARTRALSDGEALCDEYERLFVGPGAPPCQPYESLWLGGPRRRDRGSVMGPAATAVASLYGDLGLSLQDEAHELPDHIMVEWEAVAFALARGSCLLAEKLLREHLEQWMGPFCEAVSELAGEPFYVTLAALTSAWTSALA